MAEPSLATIPDAFATMRSVFQPSRAAGVDKTIQFDFTGREADTWTVTVRNAMFEYRRGTANNPDATVRVDSDTWLAILRSELAPLDAVLSGQMQIAGDMSLMVRFQSWFDRPANV